MQSQIHWSIHNSTKTTKKYTTCCWLCFVSGVSVLKSYITVTECIWQLYRDQISQAHLRHKIHFTNINVFLFSVWQAYQHFFMCSLLFPTRRVNVSPWACLEEKGCTQHVLTEQSPFILLGQSNYVLWKISVASFHVTSQMTQDSSPCYPRI